VLIPLLGIWPLCLSPCEFSLPCDPRLFLSFDVEDHSLFFALCSLVLVHGRWIVNI